MAKRQHSSEIPFSAVAPLALLIEAAAAPELFKARHVLGTKLEIAEALDALSQSAVLLPHLMWEWAMYSGHIPLSAGLSGKASQAIDTREFYENLGAIAQHFPLQFSMPLPPRGKGGAIPVPDWGGWNYRRMRARAANRLHVVDRTVFVEIPFGKPEDIDDRAIEEAIKQAEASGTVPYFEEPSLRLGSDESLGHVWVRVTPDIAHVYRRDRVTLFYLISRLHEGRIAVLQEQIARAAPPLKRKELELMNRFLATEVFIHDAYEAAVVRLRNSLGRSARELVKRAAGIANPERNIQPQRGAPTVFISYSHKDAQHQLAIRQHLALLEREGKAIIWWDERIQAGGKWKKQIAAALNRASVVVLLVSRHFLSSAYCYQREMRSALHRVDRGRVDVVPAILAPCAWKRSPLGAHVAVPKDGKPVVSFPIRDVAYLQIAEAVEAAVKARSQQTKARRGK